MNDLESLLEFDNTLLTAELFCHDRRAYNFARNSFTCDYTCPLYHRCKSFGFSLSEYMHELRFSINKAIVKARREIK